MYAFSLQQNIRALSACYVSKHTSITLLSYQQPLSIIVSVTYDSALDHAKTPRQTAKTGDFDQSIRILASLLSHIRTLARHIHYQACRNSLRWGLARPPARWRHGRPPRGDPGQRQCQLAANRPWCASPREDREALDPW